MKPSFTDRLRAWGNRLQKFSIKPQFWIAMFSAGAVLSVAVVDVDRTSPGPLAHVHQRDPELANAQNCSACHGGWGTSLAEACLDCHEPIAEQLEVDQGLHGRLDEHLGNQCALCHSDHHGANFALVNRQSFAQAGFESAEAFDHASIGFDMSGQHLELSCSECHEHADVEVLPEGAVRFLGLEQSCSSCHDDPHEGALSAQACSACHTQESFDELRFERHDRFLPLTGGHAANACRDCHAEGSEHSLERLASPAKNRRNFAKPEARACASCHEAPHDAQFLEGNARADRVSVAEGCANCHLSEHTSFDDSAIELSRAQHAHSGFALGKPHADQSCADCHDAQAHRGVNGLKYLSLDLAKTWPSFAARYPGRRAQDCAACHEDPHGEQFQQPQYTDTLGSNRCSVCHANTHFDPPSFDVEQHSRSNFELTGAHASVDCAACHRLPGQEQRLDLQSKSPASPDEVPEHLNGPRQFTNTPPACKACHADAHEDYFGAWLHEVRELRKPANDSHDLSSEPWRVSPRQADLRELLQSKALPQAKSLDCDECHATETFTELEQAFDHGIWTPLDVNGAHSQAGCQSCHLPAEHPDSMGRSFGKAHAEFGEFTGCATCHSDPHDGVFDHADLPTFVEGMPNASQETAKEKATPNFGQAADMLAVDNLRKALLPQSGCARCHEQSSFRALPRDFDHGLWTGFELSGAHGTTDCASCHEPLAQPTKEGRTWARAKGNACVDCHSDPHAGQFLQQGTPELQVPQAMGTQKNLRTAQERNAIHSNSSSRSADRSKARDQAWTDCSRCHGTQDFTDNHFDHERHSRFPLESNHSAVACDACHKPSRLQDGREVIRYRPLDTDCATCHGDQAEPLRRRRRR